MRGVLSSLLALVLGLMLGAYLLIDYSVSSAPFHSGNAAAARKEPCAAEQNSILASTSNETQLGAVDQSARYNGITFWLLVDHCLMSSERWWSFSKTQALTAHQCIHRLHEVQLAPAYRYKTDRYLHYFCTIRLGGLQCLWALLKNSIKHWLGLDIREVIIKG